MLGYNLESVIDLLRDREDWYLEGMNADGLNKWIVDVIAENWTLMYVLFHLESRNSVVMVGTAESVLRLPGISYRRRRRG